LSAELDAPLTGIQKARKIYVCLGQLFDTKFGYISYVWLLVYYLYFLDPF